MRARKTITRILSFSFVLVVLSSCGLWPYKSDFDCPVPEGEQCQSLYETNLKADSGRYAPAFLSGPPTSVTRTTSVTRPTPTPKACCSACAFHKPCKVSL